MSLEGHVSPEAWLLQAEEGKAGDTYEETRERLLFSMAASLIQITEELKAAGEELKAYRQDERFRYEMTGRHHR